MAAKRGYNRPKTNKTSKYGAKKTEINGIVFDSKKEAKRYLQLLDMVAIGQIDNLRRQVAYELIPSQRDDAGHVVERACVYKADFVYTDKDTGTEIVEDTKGVRTDAYIIKRKLMLEKYGIRVKEV